MKWRQNRPRREQVNQRLGNQDKRINTEVREGALTKARPPLCTSEIGRSASKSATWRRNIWATSLSRSSAREPQENQVSRGDREVERLVGDGHFHVFQRLGSAGKSLRLA